jgi:hypothetical protein
MKSVSKKGGPVVMTNEEYIEAAKTGTLHLYDKIASLEAELAKVPGREREAFIKGVQWHATPSPDKIECPADEARSRFPDAEGG